LKFTFTSRQTYGLARGKEKKIRQMKTK